MACKNCPVLSREMAILKQELALLTIKYEGIAKLCCKSDSVTSSTNSKTYATAASIAPRPMSAAIAQPVKKTEWQVQCKAGSRRKNIGLANSASPVKINNRFSVLEEVEETKVNIVGDSIIRDQGIIMRRRSRKRCQATCFPGAGIEKIAASLPVLKSPFQATVVAVGGNDIGGEKIPSLRIKFRALLSKLAERRSPGVVMGILPRLKANNKWANDVWEINNFLHKQCIERGLTFINCWEYFQKRPYLYQKDGIHLSARGKNTISDIISEVTEESSLYLPFLN